MHRIKNHGWDKDIAFLLNHIGEDVELYADSDEWNKKEIRSALEYCLRDEVDKAKAEQYNFVVKGWLYDDNYCVVQLDHTASNKKNNELLFLLKKGES